MRPTSVTVTRAGSGASSAWIPVDHYRQNFNLGIQVDVTAGTPTWKVETTSDNIFDSSVTPIAVTAAAPLDTGTTDETGSITVPVRAVRLTLSADGTCKMTVVQGG